MGIVSDTISMPTLQAETRRRVPVTIGYGESYRVEEYVPEKDKYIVTPDYVNEYTQTQDDSFLVDADLLESVLGIVEPKQVKGYRFVG